MFSQPRSASRPPAGLPIQQELAERHGETAHYAVFDERSVVYRSKVDPDSDRL
jgi:DNA-binding IclR family transcriptional regulator